MSKHQHIAGRFVTRECKTCGGRITAATGNLCEDCYFDQFRSVSGYYHMNPDGAGDYTDVDATARAYSKTRLDLTPDPETGAEREWPDISPEGDHECGRQ